MRTNQYIEQNYPKKIGKQKNSSINNLKLSELQNMAIKKGIAIKKQGKKGLINRTKRELIVILTINKK